jgi:hypothetical protein
MAVNVTYKVRCSNKNLMTGVIPPGGGAAVDTVSATMTLVQDPSNPSVITNGSINFTYNLSDDQFQIGSFYDCTMVDGVAPSGAKGSPLGGHPGAPPAGYPPPAPPYYPGH